MMLLILTITIILISGIIIYNFRENDVVNIICFGIILFSVAIFILEAVVLCMNHFSAPGLAEQYSQRYEFLTYQMENNLYENENEIGKKQLYSEIQSYNEDIASGKRMQNDVWVGVFYPPIYDELELIELE